MPDDVEAALAADSDVQKWQRISTQVLLDSYRENSVTNRIQDHGHRVIESWRDASLGGPRLDLGCGFGRHLEFVERKNDITGFDANAESLRIAYASHPEAAFVRGRLEELPFEDSHFAAVYALYSLEHVRPLDKALAEIRRVLKPNGQLLVLLPAEGGLLYNTARKYTTIPYFRKKFDIDYEKIVKIEHCNTARKVLAALERSFKREKLGHYPFGFLPTVDANLIVMASYRNAK